MRCHQFNANRQYLDPSLHGVKFEGGESLIEVHFERKGLASQTVEVGEVGRTSTQEEGVVTSGAFTGTLER